MRRGISKIKFSDPFFGRTLSFEQTSRALGPKLVNERGRIIEGSTSCVRCKQP
jgi:hypothetical protein